MGRAVRHSAMPEKRAWRLTIAVINECGPYRSVPGGYCKTCASQAASA